MRVFMLMCRRWGEGAGSRVLFLLFYNILMGHGAGDNSFILGKESSSLLVVGKTWDGMGYRAEIPYHCWYGMGSQWDVAWDGISR